MPEARHLPANLGEMLPVHRGDCSADLHSCIGKNGAPWVNHHGVTMGVATAVAGKAELASPEDPRTLPGAAPWLGAFSTTTDEDEQMSDASVDFSDQLSDTSVNYGEF